jgi:Fe2+ transport system protein FeoA
MYLSKAAKGQKGIISSIKSKKYIYKRLAAMGVFEGREIYIVSNHSGIPVLIEVSGRRIAIGRDVADKILLELRS